MKKILIVILMTILFIPYVVNAKEKENIINKFLIDF